MIRSINTTKVHEDAYFDKETVEKISKLAGKPLASHITIEKSENNQSHEKIENVYFNDKDGLLSKFFNKADNKSK
jgi:hypothetical protein